MLSFPHIFIRTASKSTSAKSLSRAAAELHWLRVSPFPTVAPIYRGHSRKKPQFLPWPTLTAGAWALQDIVCRSLLTGSSEQQKYSWAEYLERKCRLNQWSRIKNQQFTKKGNRPEKGVRFHCIWNEHRFVHCSTVVYQDTVNVYMGPV